MRLPVLLLCFLILWVGASKGYEIDTHREMSARAVDASILERYISRELGIVPPNDRFDAVSATITENNGTPRGWIQEGSVLEDEYTGGTTALRFRNHFYDPLPGASNGGGLTVWGIQLGGPAPTWAIAGGGSNDYSWAKARQYFYEAFTDESPQLREQKFAKAFRAIGQVVHVLQDMAQPQHTRNDSHASGSLYEQWTKSHHGQLPWDGYVAVYRDGNRYPMRYGDTDTDTFKFVYDFWRHAGDKGLAGYSNRGFVSVDTNFTTNASGPVLGGVADILPSPGFPLPDNSGAHIERRAIDDLLPGTTLSGDVDFITTPVYDAYTNTTGINHQTSTYSIFDSDLQKYNKSVVALANSGGTYQTKAVLTLNSFNFESAWPFLIPRAVGYSAGLINYFFRGAFSVEVTDYAAGQYVVSNGTGEVMDGAFAIYGEDALGHRHLVSAPSLALAANGQRSFPFTFSPDPAVSDYTIVFRGTLGNENGAVAATQLHVISAPIVHVNGPSSGATVFDPQNDLVSYDWGASCWHEFPDGSVLFCSLQVSNRSGNLSGGPAVGPPAFEIPNMCDECALSLDVVDSQGHSGWGYYSWVVQ